METHRTIVAGAQTKAQRRPSTDSKPRGANGHLVRLAHRVPMGVFAARTRQRLWHDLLASLARLALGRRLGKSLAAASRRIGIGRPDRLVESGARQLLGAG